MMEVEKLWGLKAEVDIMEVEDDAGGLLTRERKKKTADLDLGLSGLGLANNGEEEESFKVKAAEEEAEAHVPEAVEHKSVFFDPTQVPQNVTEVSADKEVTEVVQFGGEKENRNETSRAEEETNHDASNGTLQNGSHSNGVHEASSSSETVEAGLKLIATTGESTNSLANWSDALDISNSITNTTKVHEIEVDKDEDITKEKVNIEEYDLEKILDEQETHDLYCPNCKSCITRRVILRKRKRTVRQAIRDEPPKKPQLQEPSANASDQTAAERHYQEPPDVFRCLSCFTFFIPTGCDFNIFRIFERRDVNQQVQVQSPASLESDNCGSWLLSCFQTVGSPKKPADADPAMEPLLSGSQITNNKKNSSVEDNTSSVHSHITNGKAEQSKKPLPAGSSSLVQTTTAMNEEEIKQSFSGFHGTTSSSVTIHTSSTTSTSKISSWQSETGFMQTEARQVVMGQQDVGHQEQIPLSKPSGDDVHLRHKDIINSTTAASSENGSFFSQEFLKSEVKLPTASPRKSSSEVSNRMVAKPTSEIPEPVVPEVPHLVLPVHEPAVPEPPCQRDEWDILKAIVYGGLVESITSLSVVSAAAASGAKTFDIFVMGIANLIGGLPIIFHNIADLRNLGDVDETNERVGQYWLQLGRRSRYRLHMVIAILSYILFGLLPPVVYGFSFRRSDDREKKMMVVAAASLACVALLAMGKAHVKRHRAYITTLLYYMSIGLSGSGLSYIAGVLITRLLAHFGLIDQGGSAPTASPAPPTLLFPDTMGAGATSWASY